MTLLDLPDIEQWTLAKSAINGEMLIQSTRNTCVDIFSDLRIAGMLSVEEGLELFETLISLLNDMTVFGYDESSKELVYAGIPKGLLSEKVCPPIETEWSSAGGKLAEAPIINSALEHFNVFQMGKVTKSAFQFSDLVYLCYRESIQWILWSMLLKKHIQSGLIPIDRKLRPEDYMVLSLLCGTLDNIICANFPIRHHRIKITNEQQVCMYIHNMITYDRANPADTMVLSGKNVMVEYGMVIPVMESCYVEYTVTNKITPK